MRAHHPAAAFVLCLLAAGCARIEVYTDPEMKGPETGFLFYTPKPYLLVGRTDPDKPIEVSVKYLPDLTRPLYARPRPGWLGTSTISMTFNESGTLSTFNQVVDTKATEMVTAIGGLLTSIATANKTNREASAARSAPNPQAAKVVPDLRQAAADLRAQSSDDAVRAGHVTAEEAKTIRLHASSVELAARYLESEKGHVSPLVLAMLRSVADGLRTQVKPPSSDRETGRQAIVSARAAIERSLAMLADSLPADAYFALYEIRMEAGGAKLMLVPAPVSVSVP